MLGVTLTKQVTDLHYKNFKASRKEIGDHIRKWKDFPCSWLGRIKILVKTIYRVNGITIKIPTQFSISYGKTKAKKKSQNSRNNPM